MRQYWGVVQRADAATRMLDSHPTPLLMGCVAVGRLLTFSGPQFPLLQNGPSDRIAVRMRSVQCAQGLAHSRCCVCTNLDPAAAPAT